jgi:hypothetical protein
MIKRMINILHKEPWSVSQFGEHKEVIGAVVGQYCFGGAVWELGGKHFRYFMCISASSGSLNKPPPGS